MIQQPRIPPTGQRQAIEVHIKWREVLDYKRDLLRMLSVGTGWDVAKLDADMQRPLYMRPQVRLCCTSGMPGADQCDMPASACSGHSQHIMMEQERVHGVVE